MSLRRCAGAGPLALARALLLVVGCDPCEATSVRVSDASGRTTLESCAEVARTEAERRSGLANRAPLTEGAGLLLEFPLVGEVCVTSEGMDYDLDVLFLADDGAVRDNARLSVADPTPRCVDGIATVLEVRAGDASGVRVGDRAEIDADR